MRHRMMHSEDAHVHDPCRGTQGRAMSQMIQRAMTFHRQGRLADAEPLYRAALAQKPQQFDALHFLGVLKLQQGNAADAIGLISAALELKPQATGALSSLGAALSMLNR